MPNLNPFPGAVKDPGPHPKASMPALKWGALQIIAAGVDAVKFMCIFIVFFAPLFAGVIVGVNYGEVAGAITAIASGLLELVPGVQVGVEFAGAATAVMLSFAAWIFFVLVLFVTSPKSFIEGTYKRFATTMLTFAVSETPLLGGFVPTFTIYIWRIGGAMHDIDKKKRKKWEQANKAWQAQQTGARAQAFADFDARQAVAEQQVVAAQAANDNGVEEERRTA